MSQERPPKLQRMVDAAGPEMTLEEANALLAEHAAWTGERLLFLRLSSLLPEHGVNPPQNYYVAFWGKHTYMRDFSIPHGTPCELLIRVGAIHRRRF